MTSPSDEVKGRARVRARYRMARHAISRAKTRFGMDLAAGDLRWIRESILQGSRHARFVRENDDGREIWAIHAARFGGLNAWVSLVFDRGMNAIVTFKAIHRGKEVSP